MVGTKMSPLKPLLDGQWRGWVGLPANCSLAELVAAYGAATVLDDRARLGDSSVLCMLSRLARIPMRVWHDGGVVRRVELDRLDRPAPAPADVARFARLDTVLGAQRLDGGEWVDATRGLALTVTTDRHVVAAAGFVPTTLADYRARFRPKPKWPVPMPWPEALGKQP